MNRRFFLTSSAGLLISSALPKFTNNLFADAVSDRMFDIIDKVLKAGKDKAPIGELMGFIGIYLLETPYVGGTLDKNPVERCVVNWKGLDCVTFFENSLGLARMIKKGKKTADDLLDEITFTRYRNGKLDGYLSRLHYTADWINDNVQKGVVEDITKSLGGVDFKFKLDFMSKNSNLYPALKNNKEAVNKVCEIEKQINSTKRYYIPSKKIKPVVNKIQTGDIIAIATSKSGLDYSHTGLAYRDEHQILHFLHASSKFKKVTLDVALSDYVLDNSSAIGITVLRPKEIA